MVESDSDSDSDSPSSWVVPPAKATGTTWCPRPGDMIMQPWSLGTLEVDSRQAKNLHISTSTPASADEIDLPSPRGRHYVST